MALYLSPREFNILAYSIDHQGEVVSREQLLEAVWEYDRSPITRTVDMHITKLRQKIEDASTLWGRPWCRLKRLCLAGP